jgi:ABC-type maltose transport system permease subunit
MKATSRKSKLLLLVIVCIVLIFGVATLIQTSLRNGFSVNECTISQIISKSEEWENKTVKVEGTVEEIPLGIIQPFNYWLSDRQNQTIRIGLRWHSDTNLSGRSLTVVGVVKKGYAWVNPNYPGWWTHYIDATSIYQD